MKQSAFIAVVAALAGAVIALGGVSAWRVLAQPGPATGYASQPGYGAPGSQPYPGSQPGPAARPGYAAQGGAETGGVTLAQFQARMRTRLMRADTDHDGRISQAEWTAWRTAHPGHGGGQDPTRSFARMDTNGDGYITPDEIDAAAARRFNRLDANHDGLLTPDERAAARGQGAGEEGPVQPLNPQ